MLTGRLLILSKKEAECKEMTAYFEDSGYNVIWCTEYDEAGEILSRGKNKPDLLIFDVDIPKRREYETVEKIRMYSDMAILMLSQDDKLDSQLYAYSKKIDDYMVKPVELAELEMRVRALLRRSNIEMERKLIVGNLEMDADGMTAMINGEEIPVTTREFNILYKLLSYPKKTFTRAQLMDEFWGLDSGTSLRAVDVYVTKLRDKFSTCDGFEIKTVRGLGYKAVLL